MTKTEFLLMIATASTTLCGVTVYGWVKQALEDYRQPQEQVSAEPRRRSERPRGFIDFKTGRHVEIDPETGKEYFVD